MDTKTKFAGIAIFAMLFGVMFSYVKYGKLVAVIVFCGFLALFSLTEIIEIKIEELEEKMEKQKETRTKS
jgi:hypothetical protein